MPCAAAIASARVMSRKIWSHSPETWAIAAPTALAQSPCSTWMTFETPGSLSMAFSGLVPAAWAAMLSSLRIWTWRLWPWPMTMTASTSAAASGAGSGDAGSNHPGFSSPQGK